MSTGGYSSRCLPSLLNRMSPRRSEKQLYSKAGTSNYKMTRKRQHSLSYYILCGAQRTRVYKEAFIAIRGISITHIRRVCTLTRGISPEAMERKQRNVNAVSGDCY